MHFHSRTYGSGHPLIILHGLFGSLDNWATLARRFGEHFHVFAFDARNHGRSFHSDEISFKAMADDVKEFMNENRLDSAFLLGHSMGGKTAMLFAATFPAMVDRLVVVDIAPRAYDRKHDVILDALTAIDPSKYEDRKRVDEALAEQIPENATRQFLLKNLARNDSGRFRWKMNLPVIQSHYSEVMNGLSPTLRFEKPALFITGGKSNYVKEQDIPLIKQMFPQSVVLTIKQAGHWVHADAPVEIYEAVVRFLNYE
jgi:esterase